MRNYIVKLKDEENSSKYNYLIRKTIISSGNKNTPLLGKSYPYGDLENIKQINEVYINTSAQELKNVNNNKDIEEKWKVKIYAHVKKNINSFNIPLIKIPYDNILKRNSKNVLETLTDEIYLNPNIDIIVPPIIEFDDGDLKYLDILKIYENIINTFIETIESITGENKIAFFIPHYLSRTKIAHMLEFYVKQFGSDSLIIVDINGLFEKSASTIFFIMRKMRELKEESFSLYGFNQKPNKRSGISVPSQDFLAFTNGISYVGQSHVKSKLSKDILKTYKPEYKIFNESDLLYYPLAQGYPSTNFKNWVGNKKISYEIVKRYNNKNTEIKTLELSNDANNFFGSITRNTFLNSLSKVGKKRDNTLKSRLLNDFGI